MAKVYLITENEMKDLERRIENVKLKHVEGKSCANEPVGALYGAMHYAVFSWVYDMKK